MKAPAGFGPDPRRDFLDCWGGHDRSLSGAAGGIAKRCGLGIKLREAVGAAAADSLPAT